MGWLDGYAAVITGGRRGIGRAIVRALVDEGALVCVMDLEPDDATGDSPCSDADVLWVRGDVTIFEDNLRAVETAVAEFGHIDVFIANAAVGDANTPLSAIPEQKLSDAFDEIFAVNVKGYLLGVKAALPHLVATRGSIILTGSFSSFHPSGGGVLYVASKHAVAGLVCELAYELAPSVRVNGVAPGVAATRMAGLRTLGHGRAPSVIDGVEQVIPVGFIPDPMDHAWPYVLLASRERARAITGTFVTTDGGFGIRGLLRAAGRIVPEQATS
jgi:NAD(P)-dependent dehydrogenase (short-subunit alcohol dehydrogenase family)